MQIFAPFLIIVENKKSKSASRKKKSCIWKPESRLSKKGRNKSNYRCTYDRCTFKQQNLKKQCCSIHVAKLTMLQCSCRGIDDTTVFQSHNCSMTRVWIPTNQYYYIFQREYYASARLFEALAVVVFRSWLKMDLAIEQRGITVSCRPQSNLPSSSLHTHI